MSHKKPTTESSESMKPSAWTRLPETSDSDHGGFWLRVEEDGVELFAKLWQVPASTALVATLTFIHGLGEHILRYEHVFQRFSQEGIRVLAFDQRGFGRTMQRNAVRTSGPAMVLGDSGGWKVAQEDIVRAVRMEQSVGLRQPGIPHFVYGHSMGGLLALWFGVDYGRQMDLAGLISSAPALRPGFPVPMLKRVVGTFVSRFLGTFNIPSGVDPNGISRDKRVVDAYNADPFVHEMGSLRCLASLLDKGEEMLSSGYTRFDPDLPLLVTWGTKDTLTSLDAGKELMDKLSVADKTLKLWEGCFHEIHNEPEQNEVIQYYVEWIKARAKQWQKRQSSKK